MKLKQINKNIYYISNPANIGLIKSGDNAILIDSGLDDSTAKKILKILEGEELDLIAVINTHSHADHCGGNNYLQRNTKAKFYASKLEGAIIENPNFEPLYLFSGAQPIEDLENKFLQAKSSIVDYIIEPGQDKLNIDQVELNIIFLPGHAPEQIGIGIENVLFCGDAYFSKAALRKHKIPFYTSIAQQKKTLTWLKESDYQNYVPAHGKLKENIEDVLATNLDLIEEVENYIKTLLNNKLTTEEVLKETCEYYEVNIKGSQQYYLMNTIIKGYLSYLYNQGQLKLEIVENQLYWKSKNSN